jgi:hypothetical protein
MSARKRDDLEWLACMLVASIGLVMCVWAVPYIPTADGPQHVLSAHIENHFSDPGSIYPEYYRILPQYAGKGFSLLYGPLESMLPWRTALSLALSIIALAFAWGFALFVLALGAARERRATSLLGFLVALPFPLYMGFFPFMVGGTVGVYTLAYVVRRPPATLARSAVVAFLLLAQGVCHAFTAVMTGAVVAVFVVTGAARGSRLVAAGRMALVGAPLAALVGLTLTDRNVLASGQHTVEWELASRASEISRWFVPGPGVRGWIVIVLVVTGVVTTLVRSRARGHADDGAAVPSAETRIAWLALAFFVLALLAPVHLRGWQLFAPRFVLPASVLGLAVLRLPERAPPRVARALLPIVTACCVVSSILSARLHHQLADGCAEALAGLDAPLHFSGPRMPILFEPYCGAAEDRAKSTVPWAAMANNVNLLYLVDHGGTSTRLFSGAPSVHAIAFANSRQPPRPDYFTQSLAADHLLTKEPRLRASVLTQLAANGMAFEGIHVVGGRHDEFRVLEERGYVPELEKGSLFIARFEGCASELVLPPGALDHEPVFYEYGLFSPVLINDEIRALGPSVAIPRDTPVRDGLVHVPLPARPCGPIWVRVVWDADRSSTFSPGDATCVNAQWEGRVVATVEPGHFAIACAGAAAR